MIKRIKIRDFKSIREVDLELDPVTVLVGRSGTGKSNLVQALKFLRNVLLLNQDQAFKDEFTWDRILPVGEKDPKPTIEVFFSVPGTDSEYSYQISFGRTQNYPQIVLSAERLALGDEVLFSRNRRQERAWLWEKIPNVTVEPYHADTPVLGNFPSLQQVVSAYAALTAGIGYYHFSSTALNHKGIKSSVAYSQALSGLWDDAGNYLLMIRNITQDFHHPNLRKGLLKSLKDVNSSVESIELDSLTNPYQAIVGHKFGNHIFPLSIEQESDGFRRFYAHLLALYQPQPKLTMIFEEPENAIFPGALSLLAEEFIAAPKENRGQVILTTHNPVFLDSFDVDNVRAVEMRDGHTVVGRVSKEQRDAVKDALLTTGQLLTVERPRLEDEAVTQPS